MDGKKANLTVTDPPYNVNYEGSAGKIKNDNLENEKFYQFLFDAFTCMEKAMADDDELSLQSCCGMLNDLGMKTEGVSTGAEAVEQVVLTKGYR